MKLAYFSEKRILNSDGSTRIKKFIDVWQNKTPLYQFEIIESFDHTGGYYVLVLNNAELTNERFITCSIKEAALSALAELAPSDLEEYTGIYNTPDIYDLWSDLSDNEKILHCMSQITDYFNGRNPTANIEF